jgi:transcription antitermination factor NusG
MPEVDVNEQVWWFALQVIPKHERKVATVLSYKGRRNFLPTYRKKQRWSDRTKVLELPLFPGYVFCQLNHSMARDVLSTPGVNRMVGFGGKPYPIPDEEISALQKTMRSGISPQPEPYLTVGRKVQITDGPLAGVVGILTRYSNQERLVISVDMIAQSFSVEVDITMAALIRPMPPARFDTIPAPSVDRLGELRTAG